MKKNIIILMLCLMIAVVLILVALSPERESDVFQVMETAATIRLECTTGEKIEITGYNLVFQNAFPQLRLTETEREIDENSWTHRVTYNYDLEETDPERIELLVGSQWIMIQGVVYEFDNQSQWNNFKQMLESEFDNCFHEDLVN